MKNLRVLLAFGIVSWALGCGGGGASDPAAETTLGQTAALGTQTVTGTATTTSTGTTTGTGIVTVTKTLTTTGTRTGTGTYTATVTQTATQTRTSTGTATATQTTTRTTTASGTRTQTVTRTATSTATQTLTAVVTYTQNYLLTGTITSTNTATVYYASWPRTKGTTATATSAYIVPGTGRTTITATVTGSSNGTQTKTVSAVVTGTGTLTGTVTVPVTATYTSTASYAGGGSKTLTATGTATNTATLTWTYHPTTTVTRTTTNTSTVTTSGTSTVTRTGTSTTTPTITRTSTTTATTTPTVTRTTTNTNTVSSTNTATGTETRNITSTVTNTTTTTTTSTSTCGAPIEGNLLQNGGFDGSTSGWTVPWPTALSYTGGVDSDNCATSGSIKVTTDGWYFGEVDQCVAVTANTAYELGYKYRQEGEVADDMECIVTFYPGSSCAGTLVSSDRYKSGPAVVNGWGTAKYSMISPTGAGSAQVMCHLENGSPGWMDQIYLKADSGSGTCSGPIAGNLLQNGGFDGSTSGWTVPWPTALSYTGGVDSDNCATSGSIKVTTDGWYFGEVDQCVAVTANTAYELGYKYRQEGEVADDMECIVTFYPGSSCAGTLVSSDRYKSGPAVVNGWGTAKYSMISPTGAGSAQVMCHLENGSPGWMDQIYLKADSGSGTCSGPIAGNLLQNGGFDGSTSGWTVPWPTALSYTGGVDSDNCATSGSIKVTTDGWYFGEVDQCVAVTANTAYELGYKYRQEGEVADDMECIVTFYPGSSCAGTLVSSDRYKSGPAVVNGWGTAKYSMISPTGAGSAQVMCHLENGSPGWMDQIYLKADSGSGTCSGPIAGNLLQNGGFDGSTSGWTVPWPTALSYTGGVDSDNCATSGSIKVTTDGWYFGEVDQCVAVTANTAYELGYKYRQEGEVADDMECIVTFYPGSSCAGTLVSSDRYKSGPAVVNGWGTAKYSMISPTGAGSAQVMCHLENGSPGWMDQIYLKADSGSGTCSGPIAGNLLQNGEFDGSTSGWTVPWPTALSYTGGVDSDNCATSGSIKVTTDGWYFGEVDQCVAVTANTVYELGYNYRQEGEVADDMECIVTFYAGAGCAGSSVATSTYKSGPAVVNGWGTVKSPMVSPTGAGSANVMCHLANGSPGWLDQIYVK